MALLEDAPSIMAKSHLAFDAAIISTSAKVVSSVMEGSK